MRFTAICIAVLLVSGCTVPVRQVDKTYKNTGTPEPGTTQTVGVGNAILESTSKEYVRGRVVDGPARAYVGPFPFEYDGMYARANNGEHYCGIATNRDPLNYGKRALVCYTTAEFDNLKLPYRDGDIPAENSSSIRRLIEYGGKSATSISLHYREFSDSADRSMARPAFTQEFKFELSESKISGLKGASFEVIEATNTGIKYKVLTPLAPQ